MKYESNILKRLIDTYGVIGNPKYMSEIIKQFIVQGKECFPHLFTYQADWLAHIDEFGLTSDYVVSYTGQQFYAPHSKEKPVKRAILKGQTLVNVANGGESIPLLGGNRVNSIATLYPLKTNTKMLIKFNSDVALSSGFCTLYFTDVNGNNIFSKNSNIINGNNSFIFTTPLEDVVYNFKIYTNLTGIADSALISNLQIFEYQDGMENWEIPYFEGMQSVKMPVLTTTGKNLFDIDTMVSNYATVENGVVIKTGNVGHTAEMLKITNLEVGKTYTLSCDYSYDGTSNGSHLVYCLSYDDGWYNSSKNNIKTYTGNISKINESFIAQKDTVYLIGSLWQTYISNIQIEEGSVVTTYEPFKSNILTVNEDVVLRGIGDVKDTLDGNTGELIQIIGEIVLDGSLTPVTIDTSKDNTIEVSFGRQTNMKIASELMCDKLPNAEPFNTDVEGICCHVLNGNFHFNILKSKIENHTKQGVVDYLSQNPITVQYELATPTIKTVDLTIHDKDQQKVERLTSFEGGTHFTTSSQEGSLLPTLTVDVVTDLEETLNLCSLDGNTL